MGDWHVVKREGDEKGAAFEDGDEARGMRDEWQRRYPGEYEVVTRDEPLEGEREAAIATSAWTSLWEALGL